LFGLETVGEVGVAGIFFLNKGVNFLGTTLRGM